MRKKMFMVIGLLLVTILTCQLFAVISGDPIKTYGLPMLITNAGQGPGGKMTRQVVADSGFALDTEFFYLSEPEPKDIPAGKYGCLLVVIGSTDKGLGASGITIDDEIERLKRMVAHCKEINLPIVALLMEQDKRSKIPTNANERCIDLICPNAEWMICIKGGNSDGRFDALKAQYNIPLTVYSKAPMDLMNIFKQMLPK
ncbi:MAG: hypothetical protein IJT52_05835 [Spirochaetales bacterium]|jgi:hypothetical protein|nr:hypothetical protein [Spirochaetales bacterium]